MAFPASPSGRPQGDSAPGGSWPRSPSSPRLVVMAASAGGLEAITSVLAALPPDFPGAIAVVQHRAEEEPQRLVDILQKHTRLRVQHARDGTPLQPATVYVCPPGFHMLAQQSVRLVEGPRINFVRPNADLMFDSAAEAYGERAIGVVLSGSGSDAAVGSLSIARAGGTVIVQDLETCRFPSMAAAAVKLGSSELVLPPEQIAQALQDLLAGRSPAAARPAPAAPDETPAAATARPTRVLLADDHRIVLDGLRLLLESEGDVTVVGGADDGEAAVRLAGQLAPDVVVMDVRMPRVDGIAATRQITGRVPAPKVIALSSRSDSVTVREVLSAGASGYLTKHKAYAELLDAIRTVMANRTYLSRDIARFALKPGAREPVLPHAPRA